jgi:hypothetical protein
LNHRFQILASAEFAIRQLAFYFPHVLIQIGVGDFFKWRTLMRYVLLLLAGLIFGFHSSSAYAAQIVGIGGKCLNVKGGGDADGTPIILWPCSGTDNEQWHFRHGRIVGIGGKCLNVSGGGDASGTPIILYHCSGTENERWHREGRQIVGIGGKCLNVRGGGDANGTEIILWPCVDAPNDRWRIRD